jgi:isochorismate synthase
VNELFEILHARREALRSPAARTVARAKASGRRQWLSVRVATSARDLLSDFMGAGTGDAFYWQEPNRGVSLLGVGRLVTIEALGSKRFGDASASVKELYRDLQVFDCDEAVDEVVVDADCADARGPLLLGGFAFYDKPLDEESEWRALGAGRLILPEVGVVVRDDAAFMTRTCSVLPSDAVEDIVDRLCAAVETNEATNSKVTCAAEPPYDDNVRGPEIQVQADRPHDRYLGQVKAALEAIDAGMFEKVVLARSLEVRADEDFDLTSFLACLREIYPSCTTLAVREDDTWFISATPERLVSLHDGEVSTAAVAGSAPRGRSHDEEAQHSALLLESEKERLEHEVVKQSICEALSEACGSLKGPDQPRLLKLEGIQHLETPLRGSLLEKWRDELGVLDLVGALHPTPAVGGAPSATALNWLEQNEALDRGWYAGPVGYLDANGDGEFRVALRSALLCGSHARLFAGAGIVAGSEPERELAETRLKLRALLAPLTEI